MIYNSLLLKLTQKKHRQMTHSLQFFVYNMPGLVTHTNNFPLIRFDTDIDMYAFITRLTSMSRRSDPTAAYFVINNPQLLPSYIRAKHVYRLKKAHVLKNTNVDTDSDTDDDSDDEYDIFDGIFSIYDNLEELCKCTIDNNSLLATGFSEALSAFNLITSSSFSSPGGKSGWGTVFNGHLLSPGDIASRQDAPPPPPTEKEEDVIGNTDDGLPPAPHLKS